MADEGPPLFPTPLPAGFVRRVLVVGVGASRPYRASEWRDALVTVERGALVVEGLDGRRSTLRQGDVLWLAGAPVRALHNEGAEAALIVVVARATPPP